MNSTTNDSTTSTGPIGLDHQLKLVEQIVLGTIFISAVIANILVLFVVLKTRYRRTTRMAFFIIHLTIADLLVAIFSTLPMLIWKTTTTFVGGDVLCRLVPFLMLTSTYISVYTLVVMAIDRYQAIVHPLSIYTWTARTGFRSMSVVWCLSFLLASPQLFIFRLAHHPAHQKKTCMAQFLDQGGRWELAYIFWTIVVQFVLPVCILIFCYGSIYLIVNRNYAMFRLSNNLKTTSMVNLPSIGVRKTSHPSPNGTTIKFNRYRKSRLNNHIHVHYPSAECSSMTTVTFYNKPTSIMYPVVFRLRRSSFDSPKTTQSNSQDGEMLEKRYGASHFLSRARLKTIKLTFIVVLAYILCSTPFYVGLIIMTLNDKILPQKVINWVMTIFSLLLNLNSCSNPIICLTLSSTLFRRQRPSKTALVLPRKIPTNQQRIKSKHHSLL